MGVSAVVGVVVGAVVGAVVSAGSSMTGVSAYSMSLRSLWRGCGCELGGKLGAELYLCRCAGSGEVFEDDFLQKILAAHRDRRADSTPP